MGVTYERVWFPDFKEHMNELNQTFELTLDMRFNEGHMVAIVLLSILMVISAVGNISVLVILWKRTRKFRSRINILLIHLAIADLLVTFTLMPMEIFWAATVSWWAGDIACKIAAFFRTFGVYQSCFVLVCIGLDRYYAVLQPLKLPAAQRRGKLILMCAWVLSAICSVPQVIFFHAVKHPNITTYEQCLNVNSLQSWTHELTYSFFGTVTMYILPLGILIYCYSSIVHEIYKKSKDHLISKDKLRRTNLEFFSKAKIRTLKMTVTIILAFFICWTPYYVMAFWYWVDKESAKKVDVRIQKALFLFACTNSSMNPIVYGVYNIRRSTALQGRARGSNTCTTEIKMQPCVQGS